MIPHLSSRAWLGLSIAIPVLVLVIVVALPGRKAAPVGQDNGPRAATRHFDLALASWDRGERVQAEREFREAIRCNPQYSEAHNNLANILYLRGDVKTAAEEWALAVRADASNFQAWMNLARALEKQGRWNDAMRAYEQFLERAPATMPALIAEARGRVNALVPLATAAGAAR